ncbi:unnamed protein product [Phyllotreta striolata]|uniref:Sm domain-containing protein n=1 Tax=Phyllotreta striolata TaxID=444603 RepID=A0A9P0DGE6_PHYSR|nr:unnamed protein product [Phyllotreta striolata]
MSDDKQEPNVNKKEYNPKLDFYSAEFDPLLALNTPSVSVPVPNAKRYDNLAAFTSAMNKQKNPEQNENRKEKASKSAVPVERKWLPHQLPTASRKKTKYSRNIFTKMENTTGPLALLRKCVEEKLRIKVYTKNQEKTRGYCIAYVVAFDKHFNLALEDVTEVWTRRKKKKVPAFDGVESLRKSKFQRQFQFPEITISQHSTDKKLEVCTRHVEQILLRGEHVVLVNVFNEEEKSEI